MKLHFTAHHASENQVYLIMLSDKYGYFPPEEADVIVSIGGDGFMLETIHKAYALQKPVFGMKGGSLGFLMNSFSTDNLITRIENAVPQTLYPLRMLAEKTNGKTIESLAFNDVVLQRKSRQAAKIKLYLDDVLRIEELVCDGVMVSTPAGSTAYNLSVSGPVLPIGSNVLALTPISPFRPRRWRGAILPHTSHIRLEVLALHKRPVGLTADHLEVDPIHKVHIVEDRQKSVTLLYDKEHPLPERILSEQFVEG